MKFQANLLIAASIFLLIFAFPAVVSAQTGATFDLSHNVIAGGGEMKSAGGNFKADGTIGQALAGTTSNSAIYGLQGGFWFAQPLAPTAARVSISGRVNNPEGGIIRRARILLTDTTTNEIRTAQTNTFGCYRFENLEVGRVYMVKAESVNFAFTPETYVFTLLDTRDDLNFTAVALQ